MSLFRYGDVKLNLVPLTEAESLCRLDTSLEEPRRVLKRDTVRVKVELVGWSSESELCCSPACDRSPAFRLSTMT